VAIRIVSHCPELSSAMHAFNLRMRAGGSPWGFYVEPEPEWIPKRPGKAVWREYYAAVDEQNEVHGAFALKPQDWWVRGTTHVIADWQGPYSEGSVDARYATLAMRLVRDMLSKRPLLYSWGHGGHDQPVVQMLRKMGWLMHSTPYCLKVLKPARFLRLNGYLRTTLARRMALDALAFSGAGLAGFLALHTALRLKSARRFRSSATEVNSFGEWADRIWERYKDCYAAIAVRDADSMNTLAPAGGWPPVVRLQVRRDEQVIGWALVMHSRMRSDWRFGDLYVGSVVDSFADPADAGEVVFAATAFLKMRGVDIVGSNQSHPAWVRGFAENGFLVLPDRRLFAASPALQQLLEPFQEAAQGLHLTNMDGHGPVAL
jgi:hypothetical protein